MENTIVKVSNVSAGYGKKGSKKLDPQQLVIKDISMNITEGKCVCLLGPNGCGKTTLLRVIAGIIPSYGTIEIDGKNIKSLKRKEIASYISFLSQMTQVYFSYSVYETVMHGRYLHEKSLLSKVTARDKDIVEQTLKALGLLDIAHKQITALSGGQLQRVMLARCIAQESPVLILDEPMNHLDMKIQSEFMEYLIKWREKTIKMDNKSEHLPTIIGVFHDINMAAYIADDIALLSKGNLLSFGPKDMVLKEDLLKKAYDFDVAAHLRKFNNSLLF